MERPFVEPRDGRPVRTPAPRGGLLLGRPFGIEVRIDVSWIAIAFLILLTLGTQFGRLFPALPLLATWSTALAVTLLFFGSILLHEISHSVVARRRGLGVHGIVLFIFGGISQIKGEPRRPRDEFWIAVVGPLTSAALGLVFLLLARALPEGLAGAAAAWLGTVNLLLAVFNLLPGYPLDGGRLFRAAAWAVTKDLRKATRLAATLGTVIGGGLIVWGGFLLFTTPYFISGIWLGLIGWFLISAARRSVTHLEMRELLGHYQVRHAMTSECPRVGLQENVQKLVDEEVLGAGRRCFLVSDGDTLHGLVTVHQLRAVPRDAWPRSTVGEIMLPADRVETISASEPLTLAMEKMDEARVNQMPVVEDGAIRGLVTREGVMRVLSTELELRGAEA